MNTILGTLPKKFTLAFSGGSDSTFALHFALHGKRTVNIAFFHHNTKHSDDGLKKAQEISKQLGTTLYTETLTKKLEKNQSLEDLYHKERYKFLHNINDTVITAHHLQDCTETLIFNNLNGSNYTIPYKNKNIIRPFLLFTKDFINNFLKKHNIQYLHDESNNNTKFKRNYIRHILLPICLNINPGLHKITQRKILQDNKIT